jgi:hypothetical protein
MGRIRKAPAVVIVLALAVLASRALAEEAAPAVDVTALAKKTQNPVSDVISLPFQFNFNNGGGLGDETFLNINFQPVAPARLTPDWSLIVRAIVPINNYPAGSSGERLKGLGDVQAQLYFTPARPGKLIWGVGPMFSFPTATNEAFVTGSWAVGPGAVALTITGPWVLGGLFNQFWNVSDHGGEPETNLFVFQPFVNYNFGKGWALSFAPLMTANWDAPEGQEWTVPLGVGITRTTVFNRRPINIAIQYYANVEHPDAAAGNQLRIVLAPLFPK